MRKNVDGRKKESGNDKTCESVPANMDYMYKVQYFEKMKPTSYGFAIDDVKKINQSVIDFRFPITQYFQEMEDLDSFELKTAYPGLLIGLGNEHSIQVKNAFKCGFTFDYATGIPYIPGSSVKGMLRSCFPEKNTEKEQSLKELIKVFLGEKDIDVYSFRDNIFENNDVFLGAYPVLECEKPLLAEDFITPHKELKNPNPISLLKIRPNIPFSFYFILNDYVTNDKIVVSKEEKCNLFKKLILTCGMGAKTNVGFGAFVEK